MALSPMIYVYCLVAIAFLVLTYFEGWKRRGGWDAYRVLGLVLCAAWPLLVLYVLTSDTASAQRKSRA